MKWSQISLVGCPGVCLTYFDELKNREHGSRYAAQFSFRTYANILTKNSKKKRNLHDTCCIPCSNNFTHFIVTLSHLTAFKNVNLDLLNTNIDQLKCPTSIDTKSNRFITTT